MPIVVFLLILANLLFLAFAQGFFAGGSSDTQAPRPVAADKLRIVARGDTPPPAAAPAKDAPADKASGAAKLAAMKAMLAAKPG